FFVSFCSILFNFAIGLLIAKFLGPEEYGRFALAYATAIFVQTGFFDWIRLGATRFYSERIRSEEPALRATLDFGFAFITAGLAVGTCLLLFSGVKFTLSYGLIGLALGVAVTNGLFDYHTALVRACFDDRLFARLALVKNVVAFALMGGGAFLFGSAKMTLIGTIISLGGSVVTARAALRDPASKPRLARVSIAGSLMAYSLPIVGANLLYLAIPLANRSILAILDGFSETGQFSLAYDFGTKAVQAIGSALDIVLFQIAVATHESHGPAQARQQIARNMTIVIAMVLPACTGLWLTLPSIEDLVVPEAFRGHFDVLLPLMMTGLFCMAMIQYAINPIFQIEKKTAPLIVAALAACAADPLLLLVLRQDDGASSLAIAQTGAMLTALIVLIGFASPTWRHWPRPRDLAVAVFANALMGAIVLPMRSHEPGLATLFEQIATGVIVYAFVVFGLDVAGLRTITLTRLRLTLARTKTL
ncbi:MAG TPA: polysaccharide biosynthesis C-terminal domain-containing protein, partial [Methylocella sp.]|nr:polysaccharide biosynthesis C-terminal domain-containing protein [Methylocella sp.]